MKIFPHARNAAEEVKDAATRVGQAAQWNTIALMAVAAVSIAALIIATTALGKADR